MKLKNLQTTRIYKMLNIELIIGAALGVYFVGFIVYAIYKENQIHKNKPKFHKDIK